MSSPCTDGLPRCNTLKARLCWRHERSHRMHGNLTRRRRHMQLAITFSSYWNNFPLKNCLTLCVTLLANTYLLTHNSSRPSQTLLRSVTSLSHSASTRRVGFTQTVGAAGKNGRCGPHIRPVRLVWLVRRFDGPGNSQSVTILMYK